MKSRTYKNFDEALYKLSREVFYKPHDIVDYTNSHSAFIEDLILTIKNIDCTIDIGEFGYRMNKWTLVTKSCVDKEKLKNFYEVLRTTKHDACVYTFPDNETIPLISMMFTRHDNRQKWRKCIVYMKQVELQRMLAVYMVFIHVFIRNLPKYCNVKEVSIHIGEGNVSSYIANGLFDYYDVFIEELDNTHPFVRDLNLINNTLFRNANQLSKYQTVKIMQEMKFGISKQSKIRVLDLELGSIE